MAEGDNLALDRRTFLKSTGAAGGAAALANLSAAHPGAHGSQPGSHDYGRDDRAPNEVLVGVTNTVSTADVESGLPDRVSVTDRDEELGFLVAKLPDDVGVYGRMSIQSEIATHDKVRYVERNAIFYPIAVSDADVESASPASVSDRLFEKQYTPKQVRADVAWEKTMGSMDVTIAVVDQGVKYDHPDLKDRFDDFKGKDFVDGDDDPMPTNLNKQYHGTHVAGIAAATTGNGTGVAGISNSRLISGRVFGNRGARTSTIAKAVRWATEEDADIINMSLGGGGRSSTMKQAVSNAVNNGALPICAAGNACMDKIEFPAKYDECVAVSAVNEQEQIAGFSNTGPNVDVTAPGVQVLSCWTTVPKKDPYGGKYNAINGTSMSTPVVSGVAALGLAQNPDMGPNQLKRKLKQTAVDIGLPQTEQGAGRVDAVEMVNGVSNDTGTNSRPRARFAVEPTDPHVGEKCVCRAVDSSDMDGHIDSWQWQFSDGTSMRGEQVVKTFQESGTYTVTLTVTDDDGSRHSRMKNIQVRSGACGGETHTKEFTGKVKSGDVRATQKYSFKTIEPCKLDLSYEGNEEFILYVFQRKNDFLKTECQGQILLRPRDLRQIDPTTDLTVGVYSGRGSKSPSGDYTVTVEETGFGGGGGSNESPTAAFTPESPSLAPGETVEFDASSSSDPDGSIESFEWEFGDGTTGSGETVTTSYGVSGTYDVTLTVTDDAGASASATTTVTVGDDQTVPEAAFEVVDDSVSVGEEAEFDASASSDPDGSIESFEWDFDDGATGSGETTTHAFDSVGEFDVELTVTDDAAQSDSTTKTVRVGTKGGGGGKGECGDATETTTKTGTIEGQGDEKALSYSTVTKGPCKATFTLSAGDDTDFDLYLTFDGREPTTYDYDKRSWSSGSSEEIVVESKNISEGQTFGLLVNGYQGSGEFEVTIDEVGKNPGDGGGGGGGGGGKNAAPSADASASTTAAKVDQKITFDADDSTDKDGEITNYEWDFADGSTGTGETVTHSFSEKGSYKVELTVTDDDGATATDSVAVTVKGGKGGGGGRNKPPKAAFTVSDDTVKVGTEVSFDASSTRDDGSVDSYQWKMGDGAKKSGEMVTHSYSKAGEFEVTLKVTDDAGAESKTSKTVTVTKGGGGGGGGGGSCGDTTESSTAEDSLSSAWDEQSYSYDSQLADPCQVTVKLNGPNNADFDLYVTTDGRTPTSFDYDKKSATQDSQEQVVVEDVEKGQSFGVLVDAWDGKGPFRMSIEEVGK